MGKYVGWILLLSAAFATAATGLSEQRNCRKIVLEGEVKAGAEWKAAFGGGWVFRVMPIQAGKMGYSGWDLVVDREQGAGFPDALLVATPPYNSINEHEVGTTFGLRAQDAIGWNPRSFRFLTSLDALREGQKLFQAINNRSSGVGQTATQAQTSRKLMELERQSSMGEFKILDARLTPGVSDAAPYAENWALTSPKTPHRNEPASSGNSSPLGEFHWIHFSISLWLPENWRTPKQIHAEQATCRE
jgi:hypothetical protein